MSLFDRIFRRKASSTKLEVAPSLCEPASPIATVPDVLNAKVESYQALEEPLTRHIPSLPQDLGEGPLMLLPELGSASGFVPPAYRDMPNSQGSSVRELALLRLTVALREVLTGRLFQDLALSKLEIARLYGETLQQMEIKSSAEELPRVHSFANQTQSIDDCESGQSRLNSSQERLTSEPAQAEVAHFEQLKSRIAELEFENSQIRSIKSDGLERLRLELNHQQQKIDEEKEHLERRMLDVDAQSRRLAERESTVWKNFSELQRRERLLADLNSHRTDSVPQGVSALMEEVKRLRAQIDSGASSAKKRETTLVEEIRVLRERITSDANTAVKKQIALQEQLDQADLSIRKLLKAKHELERSLDARPRSRSPSLKKTMQTSQVDSTLISVSDHRIIDWMLDDASPEQAGVDHGYLSLTGDGPWPDQQFREMMEGAGFSLWMLPDSDVEHIVVGRHSWDMSSLEQQIEAREGKQLRIYSQEMWFANWLRGAIRSIQAIIIYSWRSQKGIQLFSTSLTVIPLGLNCRGVN